MPMPLGWRKPLEDRIAKFTIRAQNGCLEWTGALINGYGAMRINSKQCRVSRVVWERHHGALPAGKQMCHRCDNPKCVDVKHLFPGTNTENMQDAVKKGRIARGERLPQSKLVAAQVREIRHLAATKKPSEIADLYGISPKASRNIVNRVSWKHV